MVALEHFHNENIPIATTSQEGGFAAYAANISTGCLYRMFHV